MVPPVDKQKFKATIEEKRFMTKKQLKKFSAVLMSVMVLICAVPSMRAQAVTQSPGANRLNSMITINGRVDYDDPDYIDDEEDYKGEVIIIDGDGEDSGESDFEDETDRDDFEDEYDDDDEEDWEEVLEEGDEIVTDEVVYTVTEAEDRHEVEYTELFDEDVTQAVIPDTITYEEVEYRVTSVAAKALYQNDAVRTLTIGKNVTEIGDKAFCGCSSLKRVYIKSFKLKSGSIGFKAFKNIAGKAAIYVPGAKYKAYKKMLKKAGVGVKAKFYKR